MYKIKNANKQSNGKLLLSFHHKRHFSSMCVKNYIKCILNVTIEITSSKVINLTKSIKIGFDVNHLNSSILLQRFAFKGIVSKYSEDLYRGKNHFTISICSSFCVATVVIMSSFNCQFLHTWRVKCSQKK